VDVSIFANLFDTPTCTWEVDTHPHQYHIVYHDGEQLWRPAVQFFNKDFVSQITWVEDVNRHTEYYVTPFRVITYHDIKVHAKLNTLPPITICAKVGLYPRTHTFPFGYLESNFVNSIKEVFSRFPPFWLEHFEGIEVPIIGYNFLDGRTVTLFGNLHFDQSGTWIVKHYSHMEDVLQSQPKLMRLTPFVRVPFQPLLHLSPLPGDIPL
jgi:hypothetical protein